MQHKHLQDPMQHKPLQDPLQHKPLQDLLRHNYLKDPLQHKHLQILMHLEDFGGPCATLHLVGPTENLLDVTVEEREQVTMVTSPASLDR